MQGQSDNTDSSPDVLLAERCHRLAQVWEEVVEEAEDMAWELTWLWAEVAHLAQCASTHNSHLPAACPGIPTGSGFSSPECLGKHSERSGIRYGPRTHFLEGTNLEKQMEC